MDTEGTASLRRCEQWQQMQREWVARMTTYGVKHLTNA